MRTIEERILDYLKDHKKPITYRQMAKYFIVSESSAKKALASLAKKGLAKVDTKAKPYLYRLNYD